MKISVITPSLNQGRFIRDCIESVKTQEGVEWEHIVVDNCSTDETLSILKEYPHLHWTSEPDKGQSDAINKGFLQATGEWVMWLNADDYLLPGALAKIGTFAKEHPEADVIYGAWLFVDKDKQLLKISGVFPFNYRMVVHMGPYIASTACFFRRQTTVVEGNLLCPEFHYTMDGEYYARLGALGKKFLYLPVVLAAFRVHETNKSTQHVAKRSFTETLARQRQYAEGMTIRRMYGITLFNCWHADGILDALLYYAYRLKKIWLKCWHGSYCLQCEADKL